MEAWWSFCSLALELPAAVAPAAAIPLLPRICLLTLIASCGGGGSQGGGSVQVGAECRASNDCAAVPNEMVECRCTDSSSKPLCVAELEPGESCAPTGNFGLPCAPGSRCVGELSPDGVNTATCLVPGNLGDACSPEPGCAEPNYCDITGHCVPGDANLGDACDSLQWSQCKPPNICSFSGVCVPPAALGEPCDAKEDGSRSGCVPGAVCDGLSCVPPKPDGEFCARDEECATGFCGLAGCGRSSPATTVLFCG